MSMKRWAAAAVVALQLPAISMAKPADLPVELRINYAVDGPAQEPVPEFDEHVVRPTPDDPRIVDIYERAERQRITGQLREARRSYQQAHLLSPMSRVGQRAMQRLSEIESPTPRNDFSEEQEPPLLHQTQRPDIEPRPTNDRPNPMRNFFDLLRRTKPLGMAPDQKREY